MNKTQEAKLNMYHAVQLLFQQNTNLIATIPAFVNAVNQLTNSINAIQARIGSQLQSTKGFTVNKANLRHELCHETLVIAGSLSALAIDTKNQPLQSETSIGASQLTRMRDGLLAPRCRNIYDNAIQQQEQLVAYGISPQKLQAYEQLIHNYAAAIPTPRNSKSKRSADTIVLKELFAKTDKLLTEKIDKLTIHFKKDQPEFYTAFISSRIIVDNPVMSTQIKGTVTNVGQKGVANAQISIVGTDFQVFTNTRGKFTLKRLQPGIYNITINKQGYETYQAQELEIKLGKTVNITAILNPTKA